MIDNQAKKAPPTNFKKGFFEKKAKREKKLSLIKNQREKLEIELRNYLEEGPLDEEIDPIVWWIDVGKEQFPLLFETAMKYLCIPATSCPSERVFSAAGEILRKRRNQLGRKLSKKTESA